MCKAYSCLPQAANQSYRQVKLLSPRLGFLLSVVIHTNKDCSWFVTSSALLAPLSVSCTSLELSSLTANPVKTGPLFSHHFHSTSSYELAAAAGQRFLAAPAAKQVLHLAFSLSTSCFSVSISTCLPRIHLQLGMWKNAPYLVTAYFCSPSRVVPACTGFRVDLLSWGSRTSMLRRLPGSSLISGLSCDNLSR